MAFNGSGVFNRIYSWVTDRNNGLKIQATRMDTEMDGFADGLSNCITRDGQSTITDNIPFNNKRITGLGTASAGSDAMNRDASDARYRFVTDPPATTTGSASTLSVTTPSGPQAVADGLIISLKAHTDSDHDCSLTFGGTTKKIRKLISGDEWPTVTGDLATDGVYTLRYSSSANSGAGAWICLDPERPKAVFRFAPTTSTTSASYAIPPGFKTFRLTGKVTVTTSGGRAGLRVSLNNGSSYLSGASDYQLGYLQVQAGAVASGSAASASYANLMQASTFAATPSAIDAIFVQAASGQYVRVVSVVTANDNNGHFFGLHSINANTQGAATHVQLVMETGQFSAASEIIMEVI